MQRACSASCCSHVCYAPWLVWFFHESTGRGSLLHVREGALQDAPTLVLDLSKAAAYSRRGGRVPVCVGAGACSERSAVKSRTLPDAHGEEGHQSNNVALAPSSLQEAT